MAWTQKFSKAHIIIIVSGILAFTSTFAYLNSLDKKTLVAKLKHDVVAGEVIDKNDVEFIKISDDSEITDMFISKRKISNNAVVSRLDLKKSDVLTSTNTTRKATTTGLQSLSISIEIGRANGGDIIAGDLIDIYETGDEARLVAKSLQVRSIKKPGDRLGISTSKELTIVVAVDASQASELSKIIGSKDIMIVLSSGSEKKTSNETSSTTLAVDTTTTIPVSSDGYTPIDLNTSTGN